MAKIRARIEETEIHRQKKRQKRRKIGLITASLFTVLVAFGFITGIFTTIYYSVAEENPELRYYLQENMGERLNLTAEDNGIKITIKSVIADDFQTLVYYEIEDMKEENQYMMSYDHGAYVQDEYKVMNSNAYPRYYLPDHESDINKEEKNVYHGKLSLRPLLKDSETINLTIRKLHNTASYEQYGFIDHVNTVFKDGEWNFEIPLTKQQSTEYALEGSAEVEGVDIYFDTLISAPTSTILKYRVEGGTSMQGMNEFIFSELEMNDQIIKSDKYGGYYLSSFQNMNGTVTYETLFEPILENDVKDFRVQFESVHLSMDDTKTIPIDSSQEFPFTFEYAGNTISVDNVEVGNPAEITISNHEIANRTYDNLHYMVITEDDTNISSMEMDGDSVIVDRNGKEYDPYDSSSFFYEEIETPRHISTVETTRLFGDNIVPTAIELYGYNYTKYLDDVVSVKANLKPSE